jgi:nucleoside-diphosphate-sugar epimerase
MNKDDLIVITGAGGFIGGALTRYFHEKGFQRIRAIDRKPVPEWYQRVPGVECISMDLSENENAIKAVEGAVEVYNLAADMGGMGFIENFRVECLRSILVNTNLIEAAYRAGASRYFFSSSACIYPEYRQEEAEVVPLKEADAYPAQPQDAYGWEKLVTERLCAHYEDETEMKTRVARFHNIYGPLGTWEGGREKVPAAFCRKVAEARLSGNHSIEVWGDGEQTRSFCYVDDCCEGIYRLMRSDFAEPLNVGQDRLISINDLADIVAAAAGIEIEKDHVPGPQGVRGRNSDNTLLRQTLDWMPEIDLEQGLARTYEWVESRVVARADESRRAAAS